MAEKKLWHRRSLLSIGGALGLFSLIGFGTQSRRNSIGFTLDWNSISTDVEIRWVRTQGGRNDQEYGALISKTSPKEFTYMPGDVDGLPEWMEIEWLYNIIDAGEISYEHSRSKAKNGKARFELKKLIPQSAIDEVLRDRERKQLKLIFTFNDDKLDFRYEVHQWRK